MTLSETIELLEALHSVGLVDKRTRNGIVEWKITEKGKRAKSKDIEELLSRTSGRNKE